MNPLSAVAPRANVIDPERAVPLDLPAPEREHGQIPIGDVLKVETRLYGTINGRDFDLRGGGQGHPFRGELFTRLESTMGELHFPMHLMDVPAVMGYPTFSKYHPGTFDLFKLSEGYEYERHMKFEDGGRLDSLHQIEYHGDRVKGDFHVEGEIDAPDIVGIEPVCETFVPAGPGRVQSHFVVAFHLADGNMYMSKADNEYRLTHNVRLPRVQFRHIKFQTAHTQERLEQTEFLNVIRDVDQLAAA
jgi:hypothetical protein